MKRVVDRSARFRQVLLVLVPVLTVAAVLLVLELRPRTYEATGYALVDTGTLQSARHSREFKRELPTLLEVLRSTPYLEQIVRELTPQDRAAVLRRKRLSPAQEDAALVSTISDRLDVSLVKDTSIFSFRYVDRDPGVPARVVNAALRAATMTALILTIKRQQQTAYFYRRPEEELRAQIAALREQEKTLSGDLPPRSLTLQYGTRQTPAAGGRRTAAKTQRRSMQLGPDTQTIRITPEQDQGDPALALLGAAEDSAKVERIEADARAKLLETLAKQDPRTFEDSLESAPFQEMRRRLEAAERIYAGLAGTLGAEQPEMKARAAAIARLRQDVGEEGLRQLRSAEGASSTLRNDLEAVGAAKKARQQELMRQAAAEFRFELTDLALAIDLSTYEDLRQMLLTTRVSAGLDATAISILDQAEPPLAPVPRKAVAVVAPAVAAGLVLASPLILVSFYRSGRSWTVEDLERHCDLPVLAMVPEHTKKDARWKEEDDSAVRFLEEALPLMPGPHRVRTVVVTSATAAEGKSTTLKSLAVSLAARGKHVLVVDADLYRPTVHQQFSVGRQVGLSTALTGHCSLEAALQNYPGLETLQVLSAGPAPPSGSELLASAAFAELLAKVAHGYDYVLIDSPPVLALSDAVGLAGHCDAVLIVVRFGKVTLREAALGVERLRKSARVPAGLVVNSVPVF